MEIRHAVHPDQVELFDTTELREHFRVQNLFVPGALKLVYSHCDRQILKRIPAGRWGHPGDLKGAVVFLASEASRYLQGHTLAVDGGCLAR